MKLFTRNMSIETSEFQNERERNVRRSVVISSLVQDIGDWTL